MIVTGGQTAPVNHLPHAVIREDRADGAILLRSARPLGPVVRSTGDWLHHWAVAAPDRVFLAERSGAGWRAETYAGTLQKVQAIAQALLARGMGADTPILIASGNGVDHGLLSLAAQYVGVPVVPVAEQYALIPGARDRLAHACTLVRPAMVYVADAARFGAALMIPELAGVEVVASLTRGAPRPVTAFADLLRGAGGVDLTAAHAGVGPQTLAKILLTSGSTAQPKGVRTTQAMMCVNQTQLADCLPFLRERPPVVVDWLPWNHVFGGSHNFNMMLANGGSFYIDDGKPATGAFDRTLENLALQTGSLVFNVPLGFSMLLGALHRDAALRGRFFDGLDLLFYAGATLPAEVWQGFRDMAHAATGRVPLLAASWGMTETAPCCVLMHQPAEVAGIIGVPVPGVEVKLIPDADLRCEIRVKGPNVMPGYHQDPVKTAESFDDEGFLITGDAVLFVDPAAPGLGLRFDGRIAEDFKLTSGTWVRVSALRQDVLARLAPLAADLVVTGADRPEIGVMIFADRAALEQAGLWSAPAGGLIGNDALRAEIAARLAQGAGQGSSTRIARALVLADPPSVAQGEITAKGSLNPRRVLACRAALLARLYDDADVAAIRMARS